MTSHFFKRLWRFLPGCLIAIAVLGLDTVGTYTSLENVFYRWMFHWREPVLWDDRIALITIDDGTLAELGQFPFSRGVYAQLLDQLSDIHPSVIAFNILFIESSQADAPLATAMRQQGHVVIASGLDDQGRKLMPTPLLQEAAIANGHILKQVESDGLVHKIHPRQANQFALGITIAEIYNLTRSPVELPPLEEPLWVNWPGPMAALPQYSLIDVLSGKTDPQVFDDKIVIVGMTATGIDPLLTPYDDNPPGSGMLLHAAVVDNVLQQRYLRSVPSFWLWGALLGGMPLMSYFLVTLKLRHQLLFTVGGVAAWSGIGLILFHSAYLLPMAVPLSAISLTGTAAIIGQRLRETLALKRLLEGLWQSYHEDTEDLVNRAAIAPFVPDDLGNEVHKLALLAVSLSRSQTTQTAIAQTVPLGLLASDERDQIWFSNPLAQYWLRLTTGDYLTPALVPSWLDSDTWQQIRQDTLAGKSTSPIEYQQELTWLELRLIPLDGNNYLSPSFGQLQHGFLVLIEDVTHRKSIELHLRSLNAGLQNAVQQRSQELASTNVNLQREILERQKIQNELAYKALHDELTELPNRYHFMLRLNELLQKMLVEQSNFAVLFLDCDRFKLINDSFGHLVGDELLKAIAKRLRNCIAQTDLVARFGGDEFTVLAEVKTVGSAIQIAQRIRDELRSPFVIRGQQLYTGCSIGIVVSDSNYRQAQEILRDADTAMYRAKQSGIGYTLFKPEMHLQVRQSLQLETDLRQALQQEELEVYYQPIFGLSQKRVAGFEALLRWHHPVQGVISPEKFIPIAEETGLIISIGQWVLQEACTQLHLWQQRGYLDATAFISVNLSVKQFNGEDLVGQVEQALINSQLNGQCLKLEITESAIMANTDLATQTFQDLKNLGIQLGIDDFGTGYSSLSHLHNFPVDFLKVDRSFVQRMMENQRNLDLVQVIGKLARYLDMTFVAEGIESEIQLYKLKDMGCPLGQGYFLCPPCDRDTIESQYL